MATTRHTTSLPAAELAKAVMFDHHARSSIIHVTPHHFDVIAIDPHLNSGLLNIKMKSAVSLHTSRVETRVWPGTTRDHERHWQ